LDFAVRVALLMLAGGPMATVLAPPPPSPVPVGVPARPQAQPRKNVAAAAKGLRNAWRTGKADAALRSELSDALAKGEHQVVEAKFPGFRADTLLARQPIESLWTTVPTKFGSLPASISLQFVLRPQKDNVNDGTDEPKAEPPLWHFMVRARELGRTSMGGSDEDVHWAARVVLSTSPHSEDSIVTAVNDHRSIWPDCREVHSERVLHADDILLQQIHAGGRLPWNVVVTARDAGAPVEGFGRDWGDCC